MHTEDAKKRHLSITSMTLMLLTVTLAVTIITITTSDNAFARERYSGDSSQAAAVNNECLNPILDSNDDIDNADWCRQLWRYEYHSKMNQVRLLHL